MLDYWSEILLSVALRKNIVFLLFSKRCHRFLAWPGQGKTGPSDLVFSRQVSYPFLLVTHLSIAEECRFALMRRKTLQRDFKSNPRKILRSPSRNSRHREHFYTPMSLDTFYFKRSESRSKLGHNLRGYIICGCVDFTSCSTMPSLMLST